MGGADLHHAGVITGALGGALGAAFLEVAMRRHIDGIGNIAGDVIQLCSVIQSHSGLGFLQADGVGVPGIPEDLLYRALFDDLCTRKELEKMAERIYAAKLLLEGKTYNQIMAESDISSATLSRVSRCVQYGQGYSRLLK